MIDFFVEYDALTHKLFGEKHLKLLIPISLKSNFSVVGAFQILLINPILAKSRGNFQQKCKLLCEHFCINTLVISGSFQQKCKLLSEHFCIM